MAGLESAAELSLGSVYRYVKGDNLPRPDALERICQAVDDDAARRDLLESFLLDSCPEALRSSVQVIIRADGEAPAPAAEGGDRLTRALEWIREECRHNAELRKQIIGLHDLLHGNK